MPSKFRPFMAPLCLAILLAAGTTHAQTGSRSAPSGPAGTPASVSPFLPNAVITEGFDTVGTCPAGWTCANNSAVVGTTTWFQGNDTVFPAQAGATTAYIGANFNSTTGTNTISTWLVSPQVNFGTGASLSFWTRTVTTPQFADRLEVRLSTAGASTNVGTGPTGVGDFTTLLTTVNPNLVLSTNCPITPTTGYPNAWCQVTVTNAGGIPTAGSGRIAFRYFVTSGGPTGANSDYIGIDTFSFDEGVAGTPGLTLAKRVQTSSNAANCPTATTSVTVPAGTQVYYCYQATNTGTLALQTHTLTDTAFGTPIVSNLQFALAAGASSPWVVSPAVTVTGNTTSAANWSACAQATTCTGAPAGTTAAATVAAGAVTAALQAAQSVPTLGGPALLMLGLLLLGVAVVTLRRH
jgi:hypothetical protein